jgi:hypothetical protein
MRTTTRLALAALTAAVALAAAVGAAGARRFELSNQAIRAVWATLELSDLEGHTTVSRCPITLEGSFHAKTLNKVCGQLVGYITEALTRKAGCGAEARSLWWDEGTLVTLPWHIRYNSFTGTLPNITTIKFQIIGAGIKFQNTSCEYKSEPIAPLYLVANLTGVTMSSFRFDETVSIPLVNLLGICGVFAKLVGTSGTVTALGTTTSISVRLVQ